jgi:periplasmic protein TonB
MFEDSLLEKNQTIRSRRKSTAVVSLLIEALIIGVVIVIPLLITQALPMPKLTTTLVAPPPPPPPPAPAAAKVTKATTTTSTAPVVKVNKTELSDLRTPTKIPDKVDMRAEAAPAAAPSMGGVMGGVPGGVQGGTAGGVIGGIMAGSTNLPAKPKLVKVSQGVSSGLLVKKVTPEYPPIAKQAHVQGSVILRAVIGKDGKVENVQPESGSPLLASAAVNAVKQWKYKPYVLDGSPVEVETTVTVNFRLSA